jgi:hypothetical protein
VRKILILAALASPAAAEEAEYPLLATTYEVLTNHPGCNGLGAVAFGVATKQEVPVDLYPSAFADADSILRRDDVCTIAVRKGSVVQQVKLPCRDEAEVKKARKEFISGFCEATQRPQRDAILDFELTACLSVGGFTPIDGKWSLTGDTNAGEYSIAGNLQDDGFELQYIAGQTNRMLLQGAVILAETKGSPARLRLWIQSAEKIAFREMSSSEWKLNTVFDLHLLDPSRSDCLGDAGECFVLPTRGKPEKDEVVSLDLLYQALAPLSFGRLPRPSLSGFAKACNEN